jgi:hypothetical protein
MHNDGGWPIRSDKEKTNKKKMKNDHYEVTMATKQTPRLCLRVDK